MTQAGCQASANDVSLMCGLTLPPQFVFEGTGNGMARKAKDRKEAKGEEKQKIAREKDAGWAIARNVVRDSRR